MLGRVGWRHALRARSDTVDDLRIQVRIAREDLQLVGHVARGTQARAAHADLAGRGVRRAVDLRARVVLGDLEHRRADRQIAIEQIPLAAGFVRLVLLRV